MKLDPPLLALAAGAFGIGVTEFTPMGLLPVIAGDLHVSIPSGGLLVSAYALGVMLGAPLVTLLTARMPRRGLLIGLAAVFTLGNVFSAVSTGYGMLLAARVLTSLNHGTFFGVGAVVAGSLVAPERRASAVAAMFTGLTIANVVGVPLATWAGEIHGWRATFLGIAALGLAIMLALRLTLPPLPAPASGSMRSELRALTRPAVLWALLLTLLGSGAMFTVFTYITPLLRAGTGVSVGFVTAMLVTYGLGLTVGNALGGRFADRSVDGTLIVSLIGLSLVLVAFAALLWQPVFVAVLIFLWGVASFALVPPLQIRVMRAAADAPTLASSVNIGAFNLGNALGAMLGGGVVAAGVGYAAVPLAGAAVSLLALILVFVQGRQPQAIRQICMDAAE